MHGHYTSDYTCYLEYWELPDGTLKISDCQGDMMSYWTVKIPSKIDGKRVSTIESGVFTMVKTQIIIEIEEGITTIQEGAFDSPYILEVNIPDSVEKIEGNPFYGEQFLRRKLKIKISPNHPRYALYDDILFGKADKRIISYLQNERYSYEIPQGIRIIGREAFKAPSLYSLSIPSSVVEIEDKAFCQCPVLTSIDVREGLQSIGVSCFSGCKQLQKFTIPSSVSYIGGHAFSQIEVEIAPDNDIFVVSEGQLINKRERKFICLTDKNIKELHIVYGTTTIATEAVSSTKIEKVFIPDTVTVIEDKAFEYNPYLTSVQLPKNLQSIGAEAFSRNRYLNELHIPASVTKIGEKAFGDYNPPTLFVEPGSYAEKYAIEHKIPYGSGNEKPMAWLNEDLPF